MIHKQNIAATFFFFFFCDNYDCYIQFYKCPPLFNTVTGSFPKIDKELRSYKDLIDKLLPTVAMEITI